MANDAGTAFVGIKPDMAEFGPALGGGIGALLPGLGEKAGLLFAGAFAAAIAVPAVGLFKLGESFEHAYDTIRTETGKTGASLQGLEGDFKSVYSTVPAGMQSVADAIGTVAAKLGLTGQPLRDVTTDIIDLSRVTKTDLSTNLQLVPALLNQWQIPGKQASTVLNEIFRASQDTGVGIDTLLQQGAKFGPTFKALNIPLTDGVSLIAQLNKNGIDAGPIMMGLNTAFAKVAKKGGDATAAINDYLTQIKDAPTDQEAFSIAAEHFSGRSAVKLVEALRNGQLNYQELSSKISKGGDTIRGAESDTEHLGEKFDILWHKVQVGLEPFATGMVRGLNDGLDAIMRFVPQAEAWLGPRFKALWASIGPDVTKFTSDIVGGLRAIGGFLQNEWPGIEKTLEGMFKNWLPGAKADLGMFTDAVKNVVDMVKSHWPQIEATMHSVLAAVEPVLVKLEGLFSKTMEMIRAVMAPVLAGIKWAWDTFGSDILSSISMTVSAIGNILQGVIGILSGIIDFITAVFTGDWGGAWNAVQEIFSGIWQTIEGIVQTAWSVVWTVISLGLSALGTMWSQTWGAISAVASAIWGIITGIVQTGWSIITGIWSFGIGILTGAWNAFWNGLTDIVNSVIGAVVGAAKGVIDGVIGLLNQGIDFINSFQIHIHIHIPIVDAHLDFDWGGAGIGHIPTLHEGGIFQAPAAAPQGLALLRSGEGVFTPEQMAALGPGAAPNGKPGMNIEHMEINAETNADSHDIARDVGWELRNLIRH